MGNRQRHLWFAFLVSVLGAMLGGGLAVVAVTYGRGNLPLAVIAPLAVALAVAGFIASLPWWRKLDYMQRDSHLVSWYWGGGIGAVVGLIVTLGLFGRESHLVAGAALVLSAQVFGYAAALVVWWFRHRGKVS